MKIIIAGAGDIGFHLAKLLSSEGQDVTLIDENQEVLDYAASHLDVLTIRGDSSSLEILGNVEAQSAKLFIAVTTSEKNNLITAILAKKMGAKQTIARVNNIEYLSKEQRESFAELGVDQLISPQSLAAQEILRLVKQSTLTDVFEFENGKVFLMGIMLDDSSPIANQTVVEVANQHPDIIFRPVAILRGDRTIIPRAHTVLKRSDHIYLMSTKEQKDRVLDIAGKAPRKVKNIMIVGGEGLGYRAAQLLEKEYSVTLVEQSKAVCKNLVENLENTLVIKGDPSNVELLKEEGLPHMDTFIALTPNTETNIITSLMAEAAGVYKTIALVDNRDYIQISQNIGIDTLINKKLIAANNIFRFVRKGKIEAITSLHGVDAEVIEFVVQKANRITKHKIKELHFPEKALIGGVIRGEETFIPNGDFQLQKGDKAIILVHNDAIARVEQLFR